MGKQRFSKVRALQSLRTARGIAKGYWRALRTPSDAYDELPGPYRLILNLLVVVPCVLLVSLTGLWDIFYELMDTPRCLIWGVPRPSTPEELEQTNQLLDRTLPVLIQLNHRIDQVRRERLRRLGRGNSSNEL